MAEALGCVAGPVQWAPVPTPRPDQTRGEGKGWEGRGGGDGWSRKMGAAIDDSSTRTGMCLVNGIRHDITEYSR